MSEEQLNAAELYETCQLLKEHRDYWVRRSWIYLCLWLATISLWVTWEILTYA